MNVGFTVKNTNQEPIDFVTTPKPYVGSYPLFTGNTHLKNWLEVSYPQNHSTPEIVRFLGGTLLYFVGDTECHPGGRDGISTYPTTKKSVEFPFCLKTTTVHKISQNAKNVFQSVLEWSKRNGVPFQRQYNLHASTTKLSFQFRGLRRKICLHINLMTEVAWRTLNSNITQDQFFFSFWDKIIFCG